MRLRKSARLPLARAQNAVRSARFRALTLEVAAWLEAESVEDAAG